MLNIVTQIIHSRYYCVFPFCWPSGMMLAGGGGQTQCFMLVHLVGKLESGNALGTDPPSMLFRRVSGMSGVFLVHGAEELRGRGPGFCHVLSGLDCPYGMVCTWCQCWCSHSICLAPRCP